MRQRGSGTVKGIGGTGGGPGRRRRGGVFRRINRVDDGEGESSRRGNRVDEDARQFRVPVHPVDDGEEEHSTGSGGSVTGEGKSRAGSCRWTAGAGNFRRNPPWRQPPERSRRLVNPLGARRRSALAASTGSIARRNFVFQHPQRWQSPRTAFSGVDPVDEAPQPMGAAVEP